MILCSGVRPPIDRLGIGEIGKGRCSRPNLNERIEDEEEEENSYFAENQFARIELFDENAAFDAVVERRIRAGRLNRTDARIDDVHVMFPIGLQRADEFRKTGEILRIVGKIQVGTHRVDVRPLRIVRKIRVVHSLNDGVQIVDVAVAVAAKMKSQRPERWHRRFLKLSNSFQDERRPSTYADHVPILFDHFLNRWTGENVKIDDTPDRSVGQGGQRRQIDVHRVGIEEKLSVNIRRFAVAERFQVQMKRMNA